METTKCKLNPELVKELDKLNIKNLNLTMQDAENLIDDIIAENRAKLEKIISKHFPEVCERLRWADHKCIDYACQLESVESLFTEKEIEESELSTFISFANKFDLDEDLIQEIQEKIAEVPTLHDFLEYVCREYLGYIFREYLELKTELNCEKVV